MRCGRQARHQRQTVKVEFFFSRNLWVKRVKLLAEQLAACNIVVGHTGGVEICGRDGACVLWWLVNQSKGFMRRIRRDERGHTNHTEIPSNPVERARRCCQFGRF